MVPLDECPKVTLRSDDIHAEIDSNLRTLICGCPASNPTPALLGVVARINRLLVEFETLPRSLDPHLERYVSQISKAYLSTKDTETTEGSEFANAVAGLVLVVAKVRGYKFVTTFFSTDVYVFPVVLGLLRRPAVLQNPDECYLLLLWLANLVLVPFELETVEQSLASTVLDLATHFMSLHTSASKTQVAALSVLALLLTRRDCSQMFADYTETVVKQWPQTSDTAKLGFLMAFNQLLKRASSSEAAAFAFRIFNDVILYELSCLIVKDASACSTTNVRYLFKVSAKISRFYINAAAWDTVADIIDSLAYILTLMSVRFDTALRESFAKTMAHVVAYLAVSADNYASQLVRYMLTHVGVDQDDFDADSVPMRHAVLLFCGFLALKRSLAPKFLPVVLSVVHRTAFVSYRSTGLCQSSQIRDASCFCMWALVKKMSQSQFDTLNAEVLSTLFLDAIVVAIFDDNLTIRRCAVAVLQEFTGRFGGVFFRRLLGETSEADIGSFTIRFIELFGTGSLGNIRDSHNLIHQLVALGFPPRVFVQQLVAELGQDLCPFRVKVVAGAHLARLLKTPAQDLFALGPNVPNIDVAKVLVDMLDNHNHDGLYALAELRRAGVLLVEATAQTDALVAQTSFDFHVDKADKGEALLNWYVAVLETAGAPGPAMFPVVLEIARLNCADSLVSLTRRFFALWPEIVTPDFAKLCRHISLGNHLLARSITAHRLSDNQMTRLLDILLDKTVDAQTRAYLVAAFRPLVQNQDTQSSFQHVVVSLLDDYIVSSQGDVGLLVRFECIDLLTHAPEFAAGVADELVFKLLRISGENLDKLRIAAFRCLCSLRQVTRYEQNYARYNNDYALYFCDLFDFVGAHPLSSMHKEAFWKGIVLTAGATVAGSDLINVAVHQVIRHMQNGPDCERALSILLSFLRIPQGHTITTLGAREKKTITAVLKLFVHLFDAAIALPATFNYEALYIRSYNLHINTSHTGRIGLVVRLFQHLACGDTVPRSLKIKARNRLVWLSTKASLETLRKMARDAIHESIIELDPENQLLEQLESEDADSELLERARLAFQCLKV